MQIPNQIILESFWDDRNSYWELGGIKIPRLYPEIYIQTLGKRGTDNENYRDFMIKREKNSPNLIVFEDFIKKKFPGITIIKEFPIPISSKDWIETFEYFGGHSIKEKNKKWFSLDYYLPEYNTAIQLDSIIGHSGNLSIKDLSEDHYLRFNHGIQTIRSSKLQFPDLIEKELKRLSEIFTSLEKVENRLRFEDTFCNIFRDIFSSQLEFIEKTCLFKLYYNDISGEELGNEITIKISNEKEISWLKEWPVFNPYSPDNKWQSNKKTVKFLIKRLFNKDIFFEA